MKHHVSALIVGVATAMLGSASFSSAQPIEIRAAWTVPPPLHLIPVFDARPSVLKHYGKSYTLKPVYFRSTPLMITGFGANEIDLAMLGPSQMNLAVLNAGFKDLRIVAGDIVDGGDGGYFSTSYLVLKDSPIKSPADLKGKTLATFAIGSSADLAMRYVLAKHGLIDKRDYTMIEVLFPNMKSVLIEKKADLVIGIPPFIYDPEFQEKARVLYTARDGYGVAVASSLWNFRESFIQKNRAAIVDLLEDYVRLGQWYWDPANRKEVVEIVAAFTKQPAGVLDSYIISKKDAYRPPDEMADLDANQKIVQIQKDLGFAKDAINLKDYSDLSMLKEANARLK